MSEDNNQNTNDSTSPNLQAPVDMTDAILTSPELTPERMDAIAAENSKLLETLSPDAPPPTRRRLDPNNPRDKFILEMTGEPASIVVYGEMKTGKTTMIAKACPNYLWIVHSKKVMRAYANEMLRDESLPLLKYMVVAPTRRDPNTKQLVKQDVYKTLTTILSQYNEIQRRWGIEGIVLCEITQIMKHIEAETHDIKTYPHFFTSKKNEFTNQYEDVYNFFAAGDWLMKFLMYLTTVVPTQIGAHVVMEANRREPKFNEKTGVLRKGGAEFLTENQSVSVGHEADYTWEVRHVQPRDINVHNVEIVTTGDDRWKRGGRDGGLCLPIEPGDIAALMVKVGLHQDD